ncbi:MAG: DUF4388 domain-containing protein [Planctomycetes bacterium]|nr:DUF4388 domain-containing protein [Planctomycetota bacterium]
MAGKSFKGNLEVLDLSNIFQSLAMNRHSGTLIVTDGKREKKIFFAEGEITLLSSSRRQRLGELLVGEDKISSDELDLALKLQRQSHKRLGEILVEEQFCSNEDIERLVRHQIEEEIYDLFLWRKAEFEFLADQMPEDMARESPNLTRLAFNTNSLIMEAMRRLDEWSLIRHLVPSTKEVFLLVDPDKLHGLDVPDRILRDAVHVIDGRKTLEALAERFIISEFELCKFLAEMIQAGALRALERSELSEKAEEYYALNDYAASAALFSRLNEYEPNEPKILLPLAESLQRTGAEKQALPIYERLATMLEGSRDTSRLRQCYQAILELDPTPRPRISALLAAMTSEQERPASRSNGWMLYALLVVALSVGLGVAVKLSGILDYDPSKLEDDVAAARALLDQIDEARVEGDHEAWFSKGLELWTKHPRTPQAAKVELPLLVASEPAGFKVYVEGRLQGVTKPGEPFVLATYRPQKSLDLQLKESLPGGDERVVWSEKLEGHSWQGLVKASIYQKPYSGAADSLGFDNALVQSPTTGLVFTPSRSGTLRVLELGAQGVVPHANWDKKLSLGDLGDVFGGPILLPAASEATGDRLVLSTPRGITVVQLPATGDTAPSADWVTVWPTGPGIASPPLVVAEGDVPAGRVVWGSSEGILRATNLSGTAAWSDRCEGQLPWAPTRVGELCVATATDGVLYAFALADGDRRWVHRCREQPQGPALPIPGRGLAVPLRTHLLLLDASGNPTGSIAFARPGAARVTASPDGARLFLSQSGWLGAYKLGADAPALLWEQSKDTPSVAQLMVHEAQLVVGWGHPSAVKVDPFPALSVVTQEGGVVTTLGSFPEHGRGTCNTLLVAREGLLATTDRRALHFFSEGP